MSDTTRLALAIAGVLLAWALVLAGLIAGLRAVTDPDATRILWAAVALWILVLFLVLRSEKESRS